MVPMSRRPRVLKWRTPVRPDCAPAILRRFTRFPVTREHGVDASRQFFVAREDRRTHALIPAFATQGFELVMKVEYQRRMREAARWTRGLRVEPDDKKSFAAKA